MPDVTSEPIVLFDGGLVEALPDIIKLSNVRVHDISPDANGRAVVKWSNRYLYESCNLSKINKTYEAMRSGVNDIEETFRERMGAKFNSKQVSGRSPCPEFKSIIIAGFPQTAGQLCIKPRLRFQVVKERSRRIACR